MRAPAWDLMNAGEPMSETLMPGAGGERVRVLVVDDEPVARSVASGVLSRAGFEVAMAGDGREALEVLRRRGCRIVVSDLEMPGMNGIELCRAIRSGERSGYVYFIMLTSHSGTEEAVKGLSAGADDFIAKPVNPVELALRVNTGRRITSLHSREVTIFALAKLAESRDPDTGEHIERVQRYSQSLAQHLMESGRFGAQVDAAFVRLIYLTSPLHDIGKVSVPDSILLKPGKLTEEEFEVMKRHTVEGAATLAAALREYPEAAFLRMGHDIALHHHERYDGGGYPHGLKGEAIPLAARIVAVADVYDALTSKRVYKEAMPHEQAREIITRDSGRHFDPDVVEAFIAVERQFMEIRATFRDAVRAAA